MNKYNKYMGMFFAPENDGGGASGRIVATTLPPVETSGSGDGDVSSTPAGADSSGSSNKSAEGAGTAPPVAQPPTFDPAKFGEELKGIFKEGFATVKSTAPTVPTAPPTPEQLAEARKALNFWEPDDAFLAEFDNIATKKDALIKMRDGLLKQVLTIVEAQDNQRWTGREKQFNERLTPLQQFYQEQQASQVQQVFHKTYPTLADPKYSTILSAVGAELERTNGYVGKTPTENMKILADTVTKVLQTANPQFTLGGTTPPENNEQSSNGISSTSTGSGGGGGNSGGGTKHKSAIVSALGVPKPRG